MYSTYLLNSEDDDNNNTSEFAALPGSRWGPGGDPVLLCPQSSGRWSRRRAARAERRDRTRLSPAEMTSTSMTTRSALGQVSTRARETEGAAGVRVCDGDKGRGRRTAGWRDGGRKSEIDRDRREKQMWWDKRRKMNNDGEWAGRGESKDLCVDKGKDAVFFLRIVQI